MRDNHNYDRYDMFAVFEEIIGHLDLIQMVDFTTWSRIVNNTLKESILDHVYIQCPTTIDYIKGVCPPFGDHTLVLIALKHPRRNELKTLIKRNWRNYSKEKLIESLKAVRWELGIGQVQPFWNNFEAKLVAVVDKLAPLALLTFTFQLPSGALYFTHYYIPLREA